ncbi:MAG: helix-turn-helix transcriptional regulator [Chloroflexota bacterium]|nr:helix-turn-helix transcriptional regulator [Chloroflexota bacterium]
MPQKKKFSTNNNRVRLPFSGVVIAAVMKALEVEIESPDPRTVRRYLSGKPMSEHNEMEFFLSLGKALVETGTLPIPPIFDEYDVSMPVIAGCAIARAAHKWDRLVGMLQSQSTRRIDTEVALPGILRLVAVDAALRMFSLLRMCQRVPPAPEVPTWARENGGGLVLRRLLTEAGLSRKQLVDKMGVSETSVDNWLDGNNKPNLSSIHMLGDCLAGVLPGQTPDSLTAQIRGQFALAEIGDRLACVIGRNAVLELAENIYRFVWLMTEDVNHMNRPAITEAVGVEFDTFRLGTEQQDAPTLLRNISMDVQEPEWRSYLWAASIDWEINFQTIAATRIDGSGAAGLAQDLFELPNISDEQVQIETAAMDQIRSLAPTVDDTMLQIALQDITMRSLFSYLDANISWRRKIVDNHPLSANAHLNLGSFLGMMAKYIPLQGYLEEGISECKIAANLMTNWDVPLVLQRRLQGGVSGLMWRRAARRLA